MESVFIHNEAGQSVRGNIRHLIQSILPGGPVEQNNILMVDDELLEINSNPLVGVSHDEAIQLVQLATKNVIIVVCRPVPLEREEEAPPTDDGMTINRYDIR